MLICNLQEVAVPRIGAADEVHFTAKQPLQIFGQAEISVREDPRDSRRIHKKVDVAVGMVERPAGRRAE